LNRVKTFTKLLEQPRNAYSTALLGFLRHPSRISTRSKRQTENKNAYQTVKRKEFFLFRAAAALRSSKSLSVLGRLSC
jgi:hypothetical protein